MAAGLEQLLTRLTAQTLQTKPRITSDGGPPFSHADIQLIASQAPRWSYHALMAKYCDDGISIQRLLEWLHHKSRSAWFDNPANESTRITAGQLNRLAEVALVTFLNPRLPEIATDPDKAEYIGIKWQNYRKKFKQHMTRLLQELDAAEHTGKLILNRYRLDD